MSRRQTKVYLALAWHEPGHLKGIDRYANKAHWKLDMWRGEYSCSELQRFRGHGIICQLFNSVTDLVRLVEEKRLPMVELASSIPGMQVPRVVPDSEAEGVLAATHLIERGFARLVFIGYKDGSLHRGFIRAARAAGRGVHAAFLEDIEREADIVEPASRFGLLNDSNSTKRIAWARRFFAESEKPVGVYVEHVLWAANIVEGCRAAGIMVPEQVAVVCHADTDDEGDNVFVSLTTTVPDYNEQGYQAAALLDQMMHGAPVPSDTVIKVPPRGLVARASTMCHATTNLPIARATTFIMGHLHDPNLCVKQVHRVAKIPYNRFYRNFARQFNMPVARYIERLRVEEAARLLASTDTDIHDLAVQCGFGDVLRFRRAFGRVKGMAPSLYRKQCVSALPSGSPAVRGSVRPCAARSGSVSAQSRSAVIPLCGIRTSVGVGSVCQSAGASVTEPRTTRGTHGSPRTGTKAPIATLPAKTAPRAQGKVESKAESLSDRLMHILMPGPHSKRDLARKLGREKVDGQLNTAVNTLVADRLAERTIPGKPNSRLQQYCLTEKGKLLISDL